MLVNPLRQWFTVSGLRVCLIVRKIFFAFESFTLRDYWVDRFLSWFRRANLDNNWKYRIFIHRFFKKDYSKRRVPHAGFIFSKSNIKITKKMDGFRSDRCLYDWVIMPGSLHKLFFCQFSVTILDYNLVNLHQKKI